jgi:hypothetical protein
VGGSRPQPSVAATTASRDANDGPRERTGGRPMFTGLVVIVDNPGPLPAIIAALDSSNNRSP